MLPLPAACSINFRRNAGYGERLVADLAPDQWIAQPVPGQIMNHPAWVFAHLNLYASIVTMLAKSVPFTDPLDHQYGMKSHPLPSLAAYPSPQEQLATWKRVHQECLEALAVIDESRLAAPPPIDRWREAHPTIGDVLVLLTVKHESHHLGQLSAWRRALGLPPVKYLVKD